MTKEKKTSNCCNAEMKEVGMPDFIGSDEVCTVHWECQKCKQRCAPEIDFSKGPQKPWNYNMEGMIKASNKLNMTKHNKTVEEALKEIDDWVFEVGKAGKLNGSFYVLVMRKFEDFGELVRQDERKRIVERMKMLCVHGDARSKIILKSVIEIINKSLKNRPAEEE